MSEASSSSMVYDSLVAKKGGTHASGNDVDSDTKWDKEASL
jgi:hypothetical protein